MNRIAAIAARTTVIVLAFTLPVAAYADDASQRAKAEEMMSMQHIEKTIQQIAESITKQVDEAADHALAPDATPDQKAKVDAFKKQASQIIDSQLGWTPMKPAVVDLYTKTFTEEQLDAILAFYKTPAGAAFLEKMPQINTQFGQLGNSRVAGLRDQLQKAYHDLQQSLGPHTQDGPTGVHRASPSPGAPATPAPQTPAPAAK